MLNNLKRNSEQVFGPSSSKRIQMSLAKQRRRLAMKLQNQEPLKISCHGFRHWKATQVNHTTKDILFTIKSLGHKVVKNTLIYIDLETAFYPNNGDNYTSKVARTKDEVCTVIESGFEYVCDFGEAKVFRREK